MKSSNFDNRRSKRRKLKESSGGSNTDCVSDDDETELEVALGHDRMNFSDLYPLEFSDIEEQVVEVEEVLGKEHIK